MNSPANCELAQFYLRTLSRIRQKNQIRLLVDAMLIKYQLSFIVFPSDTVV